MDYITTTQLRTNSSRLISTLLSGKSIDIIHRSKIVGEIRPKKLPGKTFQARKFLDLAKKLNLKVLSDHQRKKEYTKHLLQKYG